jgi:MYXO-CTERM domain-containing protein
MNKTNGRRIYTPRLLAPAILASCLIVTPAIGQVTDRNPTPPAGVTDTTRTREDRPDLGWLGLLGLAGLAGLMRKTSRETLGGSARTAAAAR